MSGLQLYETKRKWRNIRSKINSFENINYKPPDNNIRVFHEKLPWLKYNAPNLEEIEKLKINKQVESNYRYVNSSRDKIIKSKSNNDSVLRYHSISRSDSRKENYNKLNQSETNDDIEPDCSNQHDLEDSENTELIDDKHLSFKSINNISKSTSPINSISNENSIKSAVKKLENDENFYDNKSDYDLEESHITKQSCDIATETFLPTLKEAVVQTVNNHEKDRIKLLKFKIQKQNLTPITIKPKPNINKPSESNRINTIKPALMKDCQVQVDFSREYLKSILLKHLNKTIENDSRFTISPTSYLRAIEDIPDDRNDSFTQNFQVTHAGMDFLDQYWAEKRQKLLKIQSQKELTRSKHDNTKATPTARKEQPISSYLEAFIHQNYGHKHKPNNVINMNTVPVYHSYDLDKLPYL